MDLDLSGSTVAETTCDEKGENLAAGVTDCVERSVSKTAFYWMC